MGDVIKIEDHSVRIREKFEPTIKNRCKHLNTTFDENGQTVRCDDCDSNLNPYWVMRNMMETYNRVCDKLESDRQALNEEKASLITLRAAKEIQRVWRSKDKAPCCPHCKRGILPEDVEFGRISIVSRALEIKRREKNPPQKW